MHAVIADPVTHFIAQVVAIVALSRLLGLGARRLGQPLVIAEIVAGILLGPSFFGWLWPDVADALFSPESLGVVGTVSQVGVVLFMFLIGLELDPRLLRGRGRASVAISYATTAAPFLLGAGLAIYLHDGFADPAVSLVTFALFMGAFMSVTAFPVLARILVERRLLRSRVGAVTIACAAAADVTAWCVLAFVVAAARADGQLDALVTTALALGYVVVMLLLVRPVLVRLAARVSGPDTMSQNVAAAVLVLALVSSGLTQLMGIHAVFGAFLFGAVLPRQGGFARALAEKLEDLVIIVLVPLFFAYSGVRTEIGLLDSAGDWAVCGLILLVGTLGKAGGGALAARLSGLSWRESGALGVLMNTRGLMGIIVLNIGLDLGVISAELFSMMILMALVATVVATPLVQRLYPAELMARDLVDALQRGGGEALEAGEERILVCLRDAVAAAPLVNLAAGLARGGEGGRLYALHLVPAGEWPAVEVDDADQALPAPLAAAAATAEERGVALETLSFVSPDPADDIARVAAVRGADLVLLGSGHPKDALGSAARAVLQQTSAAVAVLIEAAPLSVLVACRGAADDRAALELAGRLVGPDGSVEAVEPATVAHAMSERVSLLLARAAERPLPGRP